MSLQRIVLILASIIILVVVGLFAFRAYRAISLNRPESVALATATPQPTLTPTPTTTPHDGPPAPQPQTVVPTPPVPADAQAFTFTTDPAKTGWAFSDHGKPTFGDGSLHVGVYKGQTYQSLLYFDLNALPPGSKVLYASLELVGLDRQFIGTNGSWSLKLLKPDLIGQWANLNASDFYTATTVADIGTLSPKDVDADRVNQFILGSDARGLIERSLGTTGIVTFRLNGPTGSADDMFTWAGATAAQTQGVATISPRAVTATPTPTPATGDTEPVLHIIAIPGQLVVVPFLGTPENVVTEAARGMTATAFATRNGTPTPTPRNFATATPLIVITPQPTPANSETEVYNDQLATAIAFTTGTYTPTPVNWITATPEAPTVTPTGTVRATQTPTPTAFSLPALTPYFTVTPGANVLQMLGTPVPDFERGNILILSNHFGLSSSGLKLPVMLAPNGSLTTLQPSGMDQYTLAYARESFSPERNRRVVVAPDANGILQIWVADANDNLQYPITHIFTATGFRPEAYDPVWSPDGTKVAYVNTQTHSAELYVYDFGTQVQTQLTNTADPLIYNQHPSWSPDNKTIVFKSNRTGNFQIWIMNADGSSQYNLSPSPYDDQDPVWVK